MDIAWTDPEDRLLARSIFGTDDPALACRMVCDWVGACGAGRGRVMRLELSVGAVATVTLAGGGRLVVKVWPGRTDPVALGAQMQVQQAMHRRGFPAPAVLTPVLPLGPGWAIGMAHCRPRFRTDATRPAVRRAMAAGLARLVRQADALRGVDGLPCRTLPAEGAVWPAPHNALFDFDATAEGAGWIDAIAADALASLRNAPGAAMVGHVDWSARNMRMEGDRIAAVYDWDSVFLERETTVLGSAIANLPSLTPARAIAFVRDYEDGRGPPFTRPERAGIEAAITYALCYAARCEHALDPSPMHQAGPLRAALHATAPFRLDR